MFHILCCKLRYESREPLTIGEFKSTRHQDHSTRKRWQACMNPFDVLQFNNIMCYPTHTYILLVQYGKCDEDPLHCFHRYVLRVDVPETKRWCTPGTNWVPHQTRVWCGVHGTILFRMIKFHDVILCLLNTTRHGLSRSFRIRLNQVFRRTGVRVHHRSSEMWKNGQDTTIPSVESVEMARSASTLHIGQTMETCKKQGVNFVFILFVCMTQTLNVQWLIFQLRWMRIGLMRAGGINLNRIYWPVLDSIPPR